MGNTRPRQRSRPGSRQHLALIDEVHNRPLELWRWFSPLDGSAVLTRNLIDAGGKLRPEVVNFFGRIGLPRSSDGGLVP